MGMSDPLNLEKMYREEQAKFAREQQRKMDDIEAVAPGWLKRHGKKANVFNGVKGLNTLLTKPEPTSKPLKVEHRAQPDTTEEVIPSPIEDDGESRNKILDELIEEDDIMLPTPKRARRSFTHQDHLAMGKFTAKNSTGDAVKEYNITYSQARDYKAMYLNDKQLQREAKKEAQMNQAPEPQETAAVQPWKKSVGVPAQMPQAAPKAELTPVVDALRRENARLNKAVARLYLENIELKERLEGAECIF